MTSELFGTTSNWDRKWPMSQQRGIAAYCAASRSLTVTGKRYECSPYLSLRSTALGRFLGDTVDASQKFLQVRRKRLVVLIDA